MKFLLAVSLSLFVIGAFAAEDLSSLKASASQRLDDQVSKLQSSKTCVNNATTIDAFKTCKIDFDSGSHIQKQEEVIKSKTIESKNGELDKKLNSTKDSVNDAF